MKLSEVKLSTNDSFDSLFFTAEEFYMQIGDRISEALGEENDDGNEVTRYINRVGLIIREIVRNYSYRELCIYKDELYYDGYKIKNAEVVRKIKLAAIDQCAYMLGNGDLGLRSGIGSNRKMFNKKDKQKVMYNPHTISLLMEAGLLGGLL